jgi:hypothetical protein
MFKNSNKVLKVGLLGNAIFSFLTGLALVIAHAPLAAYMGIEDTRILLVVGVMLLPFAVLLWLVSRREVVRRSEIYYLSALDGAWVVGSAAILLGGFVPFTTAGVWIFALVALMVADFMALQLWGVQHWAMD